MFSLRFKGSISPVRFESLNFQLQPDTCVFFSYTVPIRSLSLQHCHPKAFFKLPISSRRGRYTKKYKLQLRHQSIMHLLNYPCLSFAQMQYNVYIIGVNTFIIATAFVQSAIDDNISQEKSIFTLSFTQQRFEQNTTSVYIYCSNCNSIS